MWITLFLNAAVAAAKVVYGVWAGSLAIRADGLHSVADGAYNVLALLVVRWAAQPPDEEHPYGHQKIEVIGASLIGASMLLVAYEVARSGVERLVSDAPPPQLDATAALVLGGTLVANLLVATYEHRQGRRLDSTLLKSDAHHTRSDVLVTLGVIAAAVATWGGYPVADLVVAFAISAFVAWVGFSVLRENAQTLIDARVIDPVVVRDAARGVPGVADVADVRSRGGGGKVFIDLRLQVAEGLSVGEAHDVTHRAMEAIRERVAGVADVTIHTEPRPTEPHPTESQPTESQPGAEPGP